MEPLRISEHNIDTLMMALHKKIEQYADYLATSLETGRAIDHVVYPPNHGFTEDEIESLAQIKGNPHLKSALRKLIADSIAGVFFDFFNLIDGTGDPQPELGEWTELALVDRSQYIEEPVEMLQDKFFDSYWQWRNIRSQNDWKLDIFED